MEYIGFVENVENKPVSYEHVFLYNSSSINLWKLANTVRILDRILMIRFMIWNLIEMGKTKIWSRILRVFRWNHVMLDHSFANGYVSDLECKGWEHEIVLWVLRDKFIMMWGLLFISFGSSNLDQ